MAWTKTHPLERAAEWGAPLVLAIAAAWAASMAGLPLAAKTGAGVVALSIGMIAMKVAGKAPAWGVAGFEPAEFKPRITEDELLLDDPLVEIQPESRVVKLFERDDPTPGELVLRISDYLSEQGQPPVSRAQPIDPEPIDASAALHAALANIRATLR
jgi:hypothetical protein